MPTGSLTIVLPAYNEEARLGGALDELFGYLHRRGEHARDGRPGAEELPGDVHVLVVDDGSADGTAALVRARGETANGELELLTVPHAGKGAAVRAGMLAARGDLVIFTDADMATPPDQLPLLTAALRDADVALGSRVQPDGTDRRSSQPLHRRLLGRFFHLLAGAWTTGPVRDQTLRRMPMYSRIRASGLANGCPYQPSTTCGPDTPSPRISRPPDRWSRVSAAIAVAAGVRAEICTIPVPSLIRSVSANGPGTPAKAMPRHSESAELSADTAPARVRFLVTPEPVARRCLPPAPAPGGERPRGRHVRAGRLAISRTPTRRGI